MTVECTSLHTLVHYYKTGLYKLSKGMKVGSLDFTPLCSILTFAWVMAIPFLICILPDVGMVKYISNVT